MNPTPAKRARRTSSPSSPSEASTSQTQRRPATGSPTHPILPAPVPSGPPYPPSAAGPSAWQSTWRAGSSRRSLDAGSPSAGSSPRMEQIGETGEVVFTRDVNSRAPRSMMACTRCRRQKMKCDGPSSIPCRGCRQSGQPCIFEPRSRPKSISVIPSRPPPFFPGRPGSPAGFYPAGPQPAPPITSRPPPIGAETYALRQAREPMPPPPATSIAALASPYPAVRHTPPRPTTAVSISGPLPPGPSTAYYNPPPMLVHPPPFTAAPAGGVPHPPTPTVESRLRTVEAAVRPLASIPSAISSLQSSINTLQRSVAPRRAVDLSEAIWENYRTRAWPLTPWLVGLRDATGLSGLVVCLLGKRAIAERDEGKRRECEAVLADVSKEVGRLIGDRVEWSREEIRALGVVATWTTDSTFASLAIAQARSLGIDRLNYPRRTHDDWREWIYFVIMDHLCHLPDYLQPVVRENLAGAWRDQLAASPSNDPAVRDRDHKLLAWLEYAETLAEVLQIQRLSRSTPPSDAKGDTANEERRSRALEPWRKLGSKWEAWATGWGTRNDPILSLHFDYAVLYTSSPLTLADEKIWENLVGQSEGLALLERGRDAAIGVVQAVCSAEIGRTLPYSFGLYRPLLALAILHLINLALTLPGSPVVSSTHVLTVLRQAYETIIAHQPLDRTVAGSSAGIGLGLGMGPNMNPPGVLGLLGEVVESGRLDVGRRWVGVELGKDTWRRVVG